MELNDSLKVEYNSKVNQMNSKENEIHWKDLPGGRKPPGRSASPRRPCPCLNMECFMPRYKT